MGRPRLGLLLTFEISHRLREATVFRPYGTFRSIAVLKLDEWRIGIDMIGHLWDIFFDEWVILWLHFFYAVGALVRARGAMLNC